MFALYWAGLIFLCVVPAAAISVMLYRKSVKGRRPFDGWNLALHILAPLLFIVIIHNVLMATFPVISRVDVSPISQLSAENVAQMGDIMDMFEEQDFVYRAEQRTVVTPGDTAYIVSEDFTSQLFYIDGGYFTRRHGGTILTVTVGVYHYESDARAWRNFFLPVSRYDSSRFRHIINGNGTEVFSQLPVDVRHQTTNDGDWHLWSSMLIGNVTITLSETRSRYDLIDDLSSIFIEHMVKMMKTEAAYE